jgi:hypothetical protein
MSEIVYRLPNTPWAPRVIRDAAELRIEIGVDFDRGYDIREFHFPITQAHLDVIRNNLTRHLLLWCVIEQLCLAAGREPTTVKPNENKAQRAIDIVLTSPEAEVEAYFVREQISTRTLIAHGAQPELLNAGKLFAALGESPNPTGNPNLVWEHDANRDRARRGVHLNPLDTALLKYTGRYLHGGKVPTRDPDAVDPAQLTAVLAVIATAETACSALPDSAHSTAFAANVRAALHTHHPGLTTDAIDTVSFLMYAEAADRHRTEQTS